MTNKAIYKGDDTGAFGNNFVKITVKNPLLKPISKIVFTINAGVIVKEYTDETNFVAEDIIIVVNLSSDETSRLGARNVGNVLCYDMLGKRYTCRQTLTFSAVNGVICNG